VDCAASARASKAKAAAIAAEAIPAAQFAELNITNCFCTDVSAIYLYGDFGGACPCWYCNIYKCSAKCAVHYSSTKTEISLEHSNFYDNSVTASGTGAGIIYANAGIIHVKSCVFKGNPTDFATGGKGSITLESCVTDRAIPGHVTKIGVNHAQSYTASFYLYPEATLVCALFEPIPVPDDLLSEVPTPLRVPSPSAAFHESGKIQKSDALQASQFAPSRDLIKSASIAGTALAGSVNGAPSEGNNVSSVLEASERAVPSAGSVRSSLLRVSEEGTPSVENRASSAFPASKTGAKTAGRPSTALFSVSRTLIRAVTSALLPNLASTVVSNLQSPILGLASPEPTSSVAVSAALGGGPNAKGNSVLGPALGAAGAAIGLGLIGLLVFVLFRKGHVQKPDEDPAMPPEAGIELEFEGGEFRNPMELEDEVGSEFSFDMGEDHG
jgi:hypothetical protein